LIYKLCNSFSYFDGFFLLHTYISCSNLSFIILKLKLWGHLQ